MPGSLTRLLRQAVTTTFETVALLPLEGVDIWAASPRDRHTTTVAFSGDANGCLELSVSKAMLDAVTAVMLPGHDTISSAMAEDALGEIANVIVGNLLRTLSTGSQPTRIDSPRFGGRCEPESGPLFGHVRFLAEPGSVEVLLRVAT